MHTWTRGPQNPHQARPLPTPGTPCRSVQLYTRDGTFLTQIAARDSWVWCVRPRPKNNFVALACEDGTIACYQLIFSTVHGAHTYT